MEEGHVECFPFLSIDYHPYGTLRASQVTSVDTKHRYTGKEHDGDDILDQDYFGARYLHGNTLRFTVVDPQAARYPGWSPYCYALADPMRCPVPMGIGYYALLCGRFRLSGGSMTRLVTPTGSYYLELPDDITEDLEESCFSYWRPGRDLLLQVSSYSIAGGLPMGAEERLERSLRRAKALAHETVNIAVAGTNTAAAKWVDQDGRRWLYVFVVWPNLTVFLTIVGGEKDDPAAESWALDAVRGISRTRD